MLTSPDDRCAGRHSLARCAAAAAIVSSLAAAGLMTASADVAYHDTLEKALSPPVLVNNDGSNNFDIFVAGQTAYDSNLFRLPSGADAATIVGPQASRADHINSGSIGLDGQWTFGRQLFTVNLRGDANRFAQNDYLNNVTSNDSATWNWGLGSALSGQIGADYVRTLAGFYNTGIYARDMVGKTELFGTARYQVGPRIGLYGGVLYADTSLSADVAKANDNSRKTVDFGMDFATSEASVFAVDYRYDDARYSRSSTLNGITFNPDFRDQALRLSFRDALSQKTQIEAVGGYLKRDYPSTAIGKFSGYIWRLSVDWHPTDKTELILAGSRDLQADLSAQTDYFVSNAISISPSWYPTDKIKLTFSAARDQQEFIGTNEFVITIGNRKDLVNSQQITLSYSPFNFSGNRALTFDFLYRREHRSSNQQNLGYDDNIGRASATFKF